MEHVSPMDMTPLMWLPMLLVPLIVVGALVWFGVFLVKSLTDRKGVSAPLAILQERFARGEIDEEEFERRVRVLRGQREQDQ